MAKSSVASAAHGHEHEPLAVAEEDSSCRCEDNQSECADDAGDAALVAWDGRCRQDDAMEQALEAIRLALDKETKSRYVRDCDYMKEIQCHGMKNAWRVKICRWMFETGKAFDLSVDTIGCAISYMDQFLSVESVDKIMMQLLSLVCVFSASKMHDPEPITLDELNLLCDARFTKQEFCRVEVHLLRILNWELNPPNTFTFARDFVHTLALQDAEEEVVESVTELLKFVAEDYGSIGSKTSCVALAAVQLVVGSCSAASPRTSISLSPLRMSHSSPSSPGAADEFQTASSMVRRVYESAFPHFQAASSPSEDSSSSPSSSQSSRDVMASPIAVENHPHISVMADIEALKRLLKVPADSTQRTLFTSPASKETTSPRTLKSKQHKKSSDACSSKKRQRAASLSLAH